MGLSKGLEKHPIKTWRSPAGANANSKFNGAAAMARKTKRPRSTRKLSTLDEFLADQGKREEFEAAAVKEVLAWQIGKAMKANKLSRNALAQRMKTSRSQVRRLLDPKDGNVTLVTLQRAAKIVGRSLRLELI
jgi:DNA-binding Xre family transcriptional regulator